MPGTLDKHRFIDDTHETAEWLRSQNGAPFDPSDPFDAMSEMFRRQVIQLVLDAEGVTLYRELDAQRQIECFVAGALTGLICVCLGSVKPEGYDAVTDYVASCIPVARQFAEGSKKPSHASSSQSQVGNSGPRLRGRCDAT